MPNLECPNCGRIECDGCEYDYAGCYSGFPEKIIEYPEQKEETEEEKRERERQEKEYLLQLYERYKHLYPPGYNPFEEEGDDDFDWERDEDDDENDFQVVTINIDELVAERMRALVGDEDTDGKRSKKTRTKNQTMKKVLEELIEKLDKI